MRKTPIGVVLALVVMFLVGLNSLILHGPWAHLYAKSLEGYVEWQSDPQGLVNQSIDALLVILPLFVVFLKLVDRRRSAGDYVVRDGNGVVTVTEVALRKFIRSISRDIPSVADIQVGIRRAGTGLAVKLRVKVERADAWIAVKNELLRRIPEEVSRIVGDNVIHSLNVIWADFARNDRPPGRPSPAQTSREAEAGARGPGEFAPESEPFGRTGNAQSAKDEKQPEEQSPFAGI